MNAHLVISSSTELIRIPAKQILYIASDGNYSMLHLVGGEARMVTHQLGEIASLIDHQLRDVQCFGRIGKSLIINLNYVYYINIPKQQLVLYDNQQGKYTLSASREALKGLKDAIESQI